MNEQFVAHIKEKIVHFIKNGGSISFGDYPISKINDRYYHNKKNERCCISILMEDNSHFHPFDLVKNQYHLNDNELNSFIFGIDNSPYSSWRSSDGIMNRKYYKAGKEIRNIILHLIPTENKPS